MQDSDQREVLLDKVRALRAKAGDAASSKAEVLASLAMLAKLVAKYDIDETELATKTKHDILSGEYQTGQKRLHTALLCCGRSIEYFTETKMWKVGSTGQIKFAGLPSDVEMALYLVELVQCGADRAYVDFYRKFKDTHRHADLRGAGVRTGFMMGFGTTVAARLRALKDEYRKRPATGTSLVLVKTDLIRGYLNDEGISIHPKSYSRNGSSLSKAAGVKAGQKLNLSRPLGGAGSSPRIE